MKVLVVDDDEAGRYLVASLLRGYGHEAVEAVDGRDALNRARSEPVDVVVSDILMPTMDGYALTREWKADPQLSAAPVILYTASYTEPADRQFAESLGADAFIVKPQEPDALVALIEDIVRKHETPGFVPRNADVSDETQVLRAYNERLVSKLEQKLVELAESNEGLRRALEVLSDEIEVKKTLIEQLTSDIRDREAAQAELRATNEAMGMIITGSPLPIVAVDPEFTVTFWNPAAEKLFGMSAEDAVGQFYPPVRPEERDEFLADWGPLQRGEVTRMRKEGRRHRPDGSTVDVVVHGAALHDDEGQVSGLLAVFQDITEAKHIEMVKSDFVSMVSHELRTPLTSIIGYGDLLDVIDVAENPELVRQLLAKVRDRGERMRRLIDDLLEVSQIQSGPLRLEVAPTDVTAFVRSEADKARITAPHAFAFEAQAEVPEALVDPERMSRALQHLLDNAIKYSPGGGDVGVRVSGGDGEVRIAVSDQGVGLDANDVKHVFDRFTQADMSDTRPFGGLGVGLYLARRIIEAHRGRLEVDSMPGKGSTFTIVLPAAG